MPVTVQLTGFLTQRNTQAPLASLTDADVLIRPELRDITSSDFDRAAEAIPAGRDAAQAALGGLQALSLPPDSYASYRASLSSPKSRDRQVDFIRIDNQSRVKDSILAHRVHNTRVAQPLSIDALERDIGRIYGLELFQNVTYDIVEEYGQTGIEFSVRERAWGPTYLQLGAAYDSNSDGDNIFNVGVSTLWMLAACLWELRHLSVRCMPPTAWRRVRMRRSTSFPGVHFDPASVGDSGFFRAGFPLWPKRRFCFLGHLHHYAFAQISVAL